MSLEGKKSAFRGCIGNGGQWGESTQLRAMTELMEWQEKWEPRSVNEGRGKGRVVFAVGNGGSFLQTVGLLGLGLFRSRHWWGQWWRFQARSLSL